MLIPSDLDRISAMLGMAYEEWPGIIEPEYGIRLSMLHRGGGSGELGAQGCIALLRSLKLGPPAELKPVEQKVDWDGLPTDGSVCVEARYSGAWKAGRFLGFVQAGILAVRLDDDEYVRECRPDMVRLSDVPFAPVDDRNASQQLAAEAVAEEETETEQQSNRPNWFQVPAGAKVWIEEDDDYQEAAFLGASVDDSPGSNEFRVRMKATGEERLVSADLLTYGGD